MFLSSALVTLCMPFVAAVQLGGSPGTCRGPKHPSFAEFVAKHGRKYMAGSLEYRRREALYQHNLEQIDLMNCVHGWTSGVTPLADWTGTEIRSLYGYRAVKHPERSRDRSSSMNPMLDRLHQLPREQTWENLAAVQEPRDQGACGSCWAFAAESSMRAHAEIAQKPRRFSVAQLVNCVPNPQQCGGQGGCEGATAELAFEYTLRYGLVEESKMRYPVQGGQEPCPGSMQASAPNATTAMIESGVEMHRVRTDDSMALGPALGMTGWLKFPENKALLMMRGLVQHGPTTVGIASGAAMSFYTEGIMGSAGCDRKTINHAMVLYGFGGHTTARYWQLKNSWGSEWGERGNMRLTRGTIQEEEADCGWDTQPEVGLGCLGGPSRVWVCGTCGILYDAVMPRFE